MLRNALWTTADRGVGAPKRGGESKNNANLHNQKHVGAQSGNLAQGTKNHRSASVRVCGQTVVLKYSISTYGHYLAQIGVRSSLLRSA